MSQITKERSYTSPGKLRICDFDFSGKLRAGDGVATISSMTCTPTLTVSAQAISTPFVQGKITGWVLGQVYTLYAAVTTTLGEELDHAYEVAVISPGT